MSEILSLQPQSVWKNFHNINQIPRPSKKEEKIRAFMIEFGKNLGLPTQEDATGNVLITKPASPGMENRKKVILQAHLDMVCQKNNDVDFDFDTQGIRTKVEGGYVKAEGTTLGADNGMGVAGIMAILESKDIEHPAIEAFFTVDEETGMTGALGLKANFLTGDILLNLDTENDEELTIGCAGGVDVTAIKNIDYESIPNGFVGYELYLKGMQGGHSGMQIHEGLGNSNKLLARFLDFGLDFQIQIAQMESGGLRNAIPREGWVHFVAPEKHSVELESCFEELKSAVLSEYKTKEPDLNIALKRMNGLTQALSIKETQLFSRTLSVVQNGVFRMSPTVDGLVETSNNLARVVLKDGVAKFLCLTRSSVESGKEQLKRILKAGFEMAGYEVTFSGSYPGWAANVQSEILNICERIYQDLYEHAPNVAACHAGLECGILGTHYPNMDMISFGPNILGAHSPDERVEIASVQKFWNYLLEILKQIPQK